MTALPSSTKLSILAHPVVAAWLAKLLLEDRAEVERQYEGWAPDAHRAYFFFALACLDPSPTPLEPTYAAVATGKTWLESLCALYRGMQSDVLIQLSLDCTATAADLEQLALSPDMTEPWTVLDLSDYQALSKDPEAQPAQVLDALISLVKSRISAGDPEALATTPYTVHSDLAPYSTGKRQSMLDYSDVAAWLARLTPGDLATVHHLYKTWPAQTDIHDECRLLLGLAEQDPGPSARPAFDSTDASSYGATYLHEVWTTAVQLRSKACFKYAFDHLKTPSEVTTLRHMDLSLSGEWLNLDMADYVKVEKRIAKKSGSARDLLGALVAQAKKKKRTTPGPITAIPVPAFHAQKNKELCATLERTYLSLLYC